MDQRLAQHFGSTRIENLWRPFFCVSTNLTTGTLAVHRSGTLATTLRASISIPGLLPPVMIAGDAHVDGGIMNYLPVDVMSRKRGPVIAVDVGSVPVSKPVGDAAGCDRFASSCAWPEYRHLILVRAATVNGNLRAKTMRAQADMLFEPPLDNVDLLDWRACDRTIKPYRYAIETLEHCDKSTLRDHGDVIPSTQLAPSDLVPFAYHFLSFQVWIAGPSLSISSRAPTSPRSTL